MARIRWKLMTAVLGLSIGGLAAMAGSSMTPKSAAKRCPDPVPVGIPVIPAPVAGQVTATPPLDVPVPTPTQLPVVPSISTPAEVIPVAAATVEVAPMPRSGSVQVQVLTLPMIATAEPVASIPTFPPVQPLPTPVQAVPQQAVPALPPIPAQPVVAQQVPATPVVPAAPAQPPVQVSASEPAIPSQPAPTPPTPPVAPSAPAPQPLTPTPPATPPAPATPEVQAAPVLEKKLKVMLHMGDERPRFEIRDGEETYLKVVCDKVDVKSPTDKGETTSTMRAVGKVAFITPGGDGFCDELTVAPGTGIVTVSGKVSFRYTWGKAETLVTGDRMTFRLGHTPGQTTLAPTTVPASYTPRP